MTALDDGNLGTFDLFVIVITYPPDGLVYLSFRQSLSVLDLAVPPGCERDKESCDKDLHVIDEQLQSSKAVGGKSCVPQSSFIQNRVWCSVLSWLQ